MHSGVLTNFLDSFIRIANSQRNKDFLKNLKSRAAGEEIPASNDSEAARHHVHKNPPLHPGDVCLHDEFD
jgi:hypothetical protein